MTDEPFIVRKHGAYVTISCCVAGTCDPGDHPTPPRLPWSRRARWRLAYWWHAHRLHIHLGPCPDNEDTW